MAVANKELGKGPGIASYGRYESSNLYKQDWGYPLPYPVTVKHEPLGLVSKSPCFDKGAVHSRNPESTSRLRVQNFPGLQRFETSSSHFRRAERWTPLNIDVFASHIKFQLDQYVSWRPDPSAVHTIASTLYWATFRRYAFTPFSVTGRCLQLVQSQKVEHFLIVTPD